MGFLDINVSLSSNTLIFCYIRHLTQHTSRIVFLLSMRQKFGVYVVSTVISLKKDFKLCKQQQTPRTVSPSTEILSSTNTEKERIPLTLIFHPNNISVKSITVKKTLSYFKMIPLPLTIRFTTAPRFVQTDNLQYT